MSASAHQQQWQRIQDALQDLRSGHGSIDALSACANDARDLLAALPPRFQTVLDDLLDRLNASVLFSEESCSFSQKDLLDGLQGWLDHAHARMGPAD
ncbi:hypothetical protein QTH91_17475 [Variovorax dokdonensis]|uniref:Uncharacterized protein n=1 Tax=Variovorax dokdonensis TaxID=344883 RepID=A0ABT7NEB9_9BURK|nr:hypothetical protein [Variovorax dokdonensis]MDM0046287.1 hypothetical protein [Variovorax dokdonensis]